MLIRNNKGQVVREMNMSITQDGAVIEQTRSTTTDVPSRRTSPSATIRAKSAQRM
jgi:hypothetical protein